MIFLLTPILLLISNAIINSNSSEDESQLSLRNAINQVAYDIGEPVVIVRPAGSVIVSDSDQNQRDQHQHEKHHNQLQRGQEQSLVTNFMNPQPTTSNNTIHVFYSANNGTTTSRNNGNAGKTTSAVLSAAGSSSSLFPGDSSQTQAGSQSGIIPPAWLTKLATSRPQPPAPTLSTRRRSVLLSPDISAPPAIAFKIKGWLLLEIVVSAFLMIAGLQLVRKFLGRKLKLRLASMITDDAAEEEETGDVVGELPKLGPKKRIKQRQINNKQNPAVPSCKKRGNAVDKDLENIQKQQISLGWGEEDEDEGDKEPAPPIAPTNKPDEVLVINNKIIPAEQIRKKQSSTVKQAEIVLISRTVIAGLESESSSSILNTPQNVENPAPQVVAPQVVAPQVVAPHVVAPHVVAPHIVAPQVVANPLLKEKEPQRPELVQLDISPREQQEVDPVQKPSTPVTRRVQTESFSELPQLLQPIATPRAAKPPRATATSNTTWNAVEALKDIKPARRCERARKPGPISIVPLITDSASAEVIAAKDNDGETSDLSTTPFSDIVNHGPQRYGGGIDRTCDKIQKHFHSRKPACTESTTTVSTPPKYLGDSVSLPPQDFNSSVFGDNFQRKFFNTNSRNNNIRANFLLSDEFFPSDAVNLASTQTFLYEPLEPPGLERLTHQRNAAVRSSASSVSENNTSVGNLSFKYQLPPVVDAVVDVSRTVTATTSAITLFNTNQTDPINWNNNNSN